jgi:hypothetical protein
MKIKITVIIISLLLFNTVVVSAQSASDQYAYLLKAGNKEVGALRYKYAIPYYRAYLQKNKSSNTTLQLIGDCYYKMLRYDSALQIYTSLKEKDIAVLEKMAELYAWKQDYIGAKNTYQQLMTQNKSVVRKKFYEERLSGFEKLKAFYKDSLDWKLSFLSINTAAHEFSPFIFQQGLLFVSNRKMAKLTPNAYSWDGRGFEDIYWVKDRASLFEINPNSIKKEVERNMEFSIDKTPATSNDNNTLVRRVILSKPGPAAIGVPLFENVLQGKGHSGSMSITEDGKTIYFSRNRSEKINGIHLLEICKVEKTSNGWGKPKPLSLNVKIASSYHPFINKSGSVLYFVSDREGGLGVADIYKVEKLNDSTWSEVENMGSRINTAGDEVFPNVNEGKLFFSSNGWGGLGGLDIFETTPLPKNNPTNMGYPVNSSSDDFGYVSIDEGREGYFSSNRYSSDDLFGYKYEQYYNELTGNLIGSEKKEVLQGIQLKLYLLDGKGNKVLVDSTQSDPLGHYKFKIRPNEKYILTVDSTDEIMGDNTGELATLDSWINRGIWVLQNKKTVIPTSPIAKNWVDSIKLESKFSFTIYHPFDKAVYRQLDEKIVQEVIQLLTDHPEYRLKIVSATDCHGSMAYNQALSERRANYVLSRLPKPIRARTSKRWVSKLELKEPCDQDNGYDEKIQEINRYTYLFISNK